MSSGTLVGTVLNLNDAEEQFELTGTEYLILFVVAAGFVLLAFMGGSSFVLVFANNKLKRKNQIQSIDKE